MMQGNSFTSPENTNQALYNVVFNQTYYSENLAGIQPIEEINITTSTITYTNSEQAASSLGEAFSPQNDSEQQLIINNTDLMHVASQNSAETNNAQIQEVQSTIIETMNMTAANLNGTSLSVENPFVNERT
jgi:predicted class III extradiol MEMO1 family dioxygenase